MNNLVFSPVVFLLLFNVSAIFQNEKDNDFRGISIDSLVKKQSEFQKQNRDANTLVFLKDSIINYYFDDFIEPCENQPTKSYYTYNINGNVATKETKNTPDAGCESDAYYNRETYSYDEIHLNSVKDILLETFDFTTNAWVNSAKKHYEYDAYYNKLEEIRQLWDGSISSWRNYLRFENTYDVHLPLTANRYSWDSNTNAWFLNQSDTYNYNTNRKLLEYMHDSWNYSLNQWQTLRKTINEYDANENIAMHAEYQKYSSENQYEWNRINISYYAYDASNFIIEEIKYSDWNNTTENWDTKKKYDYTNDANGYPVETGIYLWNETTSHWDNDSQLFTTYNAHHDIVEEITQVWETNAWINSERKTLTYNTSNLLTEELQEIWNSGWENKVRETTVYNEFDNILEYTYEYWYNNQWLTDFHTLLDYDEHQNLIHYIYSYIFDYAEGYIYYSEYDVELGLSNYNVDAGVAIVPNPSNRFISILGLDQDANVSIYDIAGKLLLQTSSKNQIDVSSLAQGMYMVNITSAEIVLAKKFIKR